MLRKTGASAIALCVLFVLLTAGQSAHAQNKDCAVEKVGFVGGPDLGAQVVILPTPVDAVMTLYEKPDKAARVVTTLGDGDELNVTAGPVCPDKNTVWWQLSGSGGLTGWGIQNKGILALVGGGVNDRITDLAFTPDGKHLLIANADRRVRLWNTQTGKRDGGIRGADSVAVSSDGKTIATGGLPTVTFWDLSTLNKKLAFAADDLQRSVGTLAFSPDDSYILTGTGDIYSSGGVARLWDTHTGKAVRTFSFEHPGWVTGVAFSPDGKFALILAEGLEVGLWSVDTGNRVYRFGQAASLATRAALSPDGKQILISKPGQPVVLKDIKSGETIRSFDVPAIWEIPLAFSPDGELLAMSGLQGETQLRSMKTGEVAQSFTVKAEQVNFVAFSPDGKQLVIAGTMFRDGYPDLNTAWLFDVSSGEVLRTFRAFHER